MTLYLNHNEIVFQQFPNKETRLDIPEEWLLTSGLNKVLYTFTDNSSLVELLLLDEVMTRNNLDYELFIPYLPYSRMDRVEEPTTAFGLQMMANLLNTLSYKQLYVLDAHSNVTYQLTNAKPYNWSIHDTVMSTKDTTLSWVVFPDKGAMTRYNKSNYANVIICEKVRDFETGQIKSIESHVEKGSGDNTYYMIDDLCSYGGTFVGGVKAINNENSRNELIVTHAEKGIIEGSVFDTFDTVYTTNSIYDFKDEFSRQLIETGRLHVYDIKELYFGGLN